ncbi:MFS transporter [Aeromicrobium sp. Leaf289]|uniref:MFS transporter n=1 Tax=Aeromicrobium sp. Leaf289 TaxID=1736324 RepID=UPI0006F39FC3|nr:MFS transporter [Aeromicrobium sp. Leaf289]KQP78259.1 MFS transporter [Aeromicrobium sp. Leaf289]
MAVWLVGLSLYFLAVFHRSSLAVAGLAASERFGISAAQLSTFVMLQLVVYAGMQIPVGLLLDRFGPRRILTIGVLVLTAAQVTFALADTFAVALVARVFVGLGDAMTFVCVLRLVTTWFPSRRIPLVTQLTGVLGQMGALVAAAPMTWALRELGWTTTYLSAASLGIVLLAALLLVVHDEPGSPRVLGAPLSWTTVRSSLAASWRHPGTRLGFWVHFTTQFSATTLGLLWGYPFFVRGEGRTPAEAGALLTILVLAVMVAGPTLAWAITRDPWQRSSIVLGIVWAVVAVWTVVLVWPGDAPAWLLVVLVVVVGVGGPASMIGFDLGRSFNPPNRLGAATGIINQGGFVASLLLVVVIGLVLDWRTPGASTAYSAESFRWAMSVQYVLWAVGIVQIWRYRRRTRAELLAEDPDARERWRDGLA